LSNQTGKGPSLSAVPDWNGAKAPPAASAPAASAPEGALALVPEEMDFELIYREYFDFACRSLRLLGVLPDALEDAAQDVFGIASRRLAEFEGLSSIKTWIFAIVQRVASNRRRSQRRKHAPLDPLQPDITACESLSPEAEAQSAQSLALIQAFCDDLDEGRRALLVLGLIEGVPMRELASTLGIPLHTAYSRIRALRQSLETYLLQHETDHG
jgi:RNA polymerase sigma-70 factor, ECF subfamily